MPKRVKTALYRCLPPNTIRVARPSRFGNPFKIGENDMTRSEAIASFRRWIAGELPDYEPTRRQRLLDSLHDLRGKNLACYCELDQECHADLLLKLANTETALLHRPDRKPG